MEEKKKVNTGIDYKNKKWRPSIFINADKRESIERWFTGKGLLIKDTRVLISIWY